MTRAEKIKNMSENELVEFLVHSNLHFMSDTCGSLDTHNDRIRNFLNEKWDEKDYTKNCILNW